jgi:hypothetical protein
MFLHRAIAQYLYQALPNSTVRMYCSALSDPFALDLIIHHGRDKTVHIILQLCDERSAARIKEFLKRFEKGNSYNFFYSRVTLRIANNTTTPECTPYSSMHDNRLITNEHCLYGSYSLTPEARCAK